MGSASKAMPLPLGRVKDSMEEVESEATGATVNLL